MSIDEFIAEDPQESLLSLYRIVDNDISVGIITRNGDMPSYMIDFDIQARMERAGLSSYYAIVDLRNVFWAGPDAREWIKGEMAARVFKGIALLVDSPMKSVMADAWAKVSRLPCPIEKFKEYEEALVWVRALKAGKQTAA